MSVSVRIPTILRTYTGGESEVSADGGTLAEVLDSLDGTAEVLDMPDAVEPLVEYFRCISGEHPDWDEYRDAMRAQNKSLVRIVGA